MAEGEHTPAPPVGEEIHMPEASLLPIVNAVGLSLAIIGSTLSIVMSIFGATLFLVSVAIWIVKARREMDALPAEHHH